MHVHADKVAEDEEGVEMKIDMTEKEIDTYIRKMEKMNQLLMLAYEVMR